MPADPRLLAWKGHPDGESGGGGDAAANDPPPEWPVATASDGTLTAHVIPDYFPPGTGGSDVGAEPSTSGSADVGARLACEKVREMGIDIVFDPARNAGDLRSIIATAASADDPELRRAAHRFMVPQFLGMGPEPLGDIVSR